MTLIEGVSGFRAAGRLCRYAAALLAQNEDTLYVTEIGVLSTYRLQWWEYWCNPKEYLTPCWKPVAPEQPSKDSKGTTRQGTQR